MRDITVDRTQQRIEPELDEIAEEFVQLARNGHPVTVEEFAEQHSRYAAQIRELFPALLALESCAHDENFPNEIGGYKIESRIGRGGMGVVYRAVQSKLDRSVALKVLPESEFSNPNATARFEQEARAVARLQHEHIVPVYDVGQAEGAQYYAMQLIDGVTLSRYIANLKLQSAWPSRRTKDLTASDTVLVPRGDSDSDQLERESAPPLPERDSPAPNSPAHWEDAATIARDIARALAHAHEHGIIHRDVKPSNILVDRNGKAWITDFGLAKIADEDLTNTGAVLGTLRYMAPEQFRGRAEPRSDVYSLGATLYELLTLEQVAGHEPSAGRDGKMAYHQPRLPKPLRRSVPRELQTIVIRALRSLPDDRYQTAGGLAEDLDLFLNGKPILAGRGTLRERLFWWYQEHKVTLLATVTCLSLFAAALFAWANYRQTSDSIEVNGYTLYPTGNDREVAELVYALGGHTHILSGEGPGHPDHLSELPDGPFHIEEVSLNGCNRVTEEIIAEIAELPGVLTVYLNDSDFDLKWLPVLQRREPLISLQLNRCNVTDAALPALAKMRNLSYLGLSENQLTDSGVSVLSELKNVSEVNLMGNSSLTDECLAAFRDMIYLEFLDVRGTQVTPEAALELQEHLRRTWTDITVLYDFANGSRPLKSSPK